MFPKDAHNHAHLTRPRPRPSPTPNNLQKRPTTRAEDGRLPEQKDGVHHEGDHEAEPRIHACGAENASKQYKRPFLPLPSPSLPPLPRPSHSPSSVLGGTSVTNADADASEDDGPAAVHGQRETVLVGQLLWAVSCGPHWRVRSTQSIAVCSLMTSLCHMALTELCLVCVARFLRRKQPWILVPLVPLSFVVGYQADLAYGNKMERVLGQPQPILTGICTLIIDLSSLPPSLPPSIPFSFPRMLAVEAESMLAKEQKMLALPGEALTVELLDRERNKGRQ